MRKDALPEISDLIYEMSTLNSRLKGMAHLIEHEQDDDPPLKDDWSDIRSGIGLILRDLASRYGEIMRLFDEISVSKKGKKL